MHVPLVPVCVLLSATVDKRIEEVYQELSPTNGQHRCEVSLHVGYNLAVIEEFPIFIISELFDKDILFELACVSAASRRFQTSKLALVFLMRAKRLLSK